MIDPLLDSKLKQEGHTVHRPNPSESDSKVVSLAKENEAPIITRDRDFVEKHRSEIEHYGIIFDPGMHHRSVNEVFYAVRNVLKTFSDKDLEDTVVRLKRFY